jgi:hypothetical protein
VALMLALPYIWLQAYPKASYGFDLVM